MARSNFQPQWTFWWKFWTTGAKNDMFKKFFFHVLVSSFDIVMYFGSPISPIVEVIPRFWVILIKRDSWWRFGGSVTRHVSMVKVSRGIWCRTENGNAPGDIRVGRRGFDSVKRKQRITMQRHPIEFTPDHSLPLSLALSARNYRTAIYMRIDWTVPQISREPIESGWCINAPSIMHYSSSTLNFSRISYGWQYHL